jgi:hypothetical protein
MRVAVVFIPAGRSSEPLASVARSMTRALESAGHRVEEFLSSGGEHPRLTGYDYVIVGTEPSSLFGKIPARVPETLAGSSSLAGKRSMAFVRKGGLAPAKALSRLMSAMEAEGMIVNCGEIVSGPEDGAAAARSAPVERK